MARAWTVALAGWLAIGCYRGSEASEDAGSEAETETTDSSDASSEADSESTDSESTGSDSTDSDSTDSDSTESDATETGDPNDCSQNPIPWCGDDTAPTPNGVPLEPPGVGGCPPGMTPVDGFCVDRWEAALVEVGPDDEALAWSPYRDPTGVAVRAVSAPDLVPQGYISQVSASAACEAAGKRLCTDSEWLRACQGAAGSTYPFGDDPSPGACNDDRTCHPAIQYFESAEDWIWSELHHPCLNQLPEGLAETGAHPSCVSEDGAFDMMGNLHEWTADPAGTFRGGFYVDTVVNGPGCTYATTAHSVGYADYSTGFRCCAD